MDSTNEPSEQHKSLEIDTIVQFPSQTIKKLRKVKYKMSFWQSKTMIFTFEYCIVPSENDPLSTSIWAHYTIQWLYTVERGRKPIYRKLPESKYPTPGPLYS